MLSVISIVVVSVSRREQAGLPSVRNGHQLRLTGLAALGGMRGGRWEFKMHQGVSSVGFLAASTEEVLSTNRGRRQGGTLGGP